MYSNCDEYLVTDPSKYKDLRDLMETTKKKRVACEAFDVVQVEGEEPIDYSKPYFQQRKYWVKNWNYNKILLSRVPLQWNAGQHQISTIPGEKSKLIKNTGLYLVHLKHADLNVDRTKRDFGPLSSNPDSFILEHMAECKKEIPEFVRNIL